MASLLSVSSSAMHAWQPRILMLCPTFNPSSVWTRRPKSAATDQQLHFWAGARLSDEIQASFCCMCESSTISLFFATDYSIKTPPLAGYSRQDPAVIIQNGFANTIGIAFALCLLLLIVLLLLYCFLFVLLLYIFFFFFYFCNFAVKIGLLSSSCALPVSANLFMFFSSPFVIFCVFVSL